MIDMMSLRYLWPFLLPLVGAWAIWLLPARSSFGHFRRGFHVFVLATTSTLLVISGRQPAEAFNLPLWGQLASYQDGLAFSADALTLSFTLLLAGVFAVMNLASIARPMERFEAVVQLVLVGAGIGSCMAANLLTLCLFWVVMDLALLGGALIRALEEGLSHAIRCTLTNLLSTFALIAVTVTLLVRHGSTRFSGPLLSELPLGLLLAMALLRLGVYPLPGSLKRRWEAHLVSLTVGSYLWLRIARLISGKLLAIPWFVSFCGATLLVTALLTSFAPDFGTSLPYRLANGVTLIVCAPLIEMRMGPAVALLVAINLVLCLAVFRVDARLRPLKPLGHWVRVPLMVALGSLIGWPLTLGFTAHWAFLWLCWRMGWRSLVLLGTLSYLLVSVPAWTRLRQMRREVEEKDRPLRQEMWVSLGCAGLIATFLLVLGLVPSLAQALWARAGSSFPSLTWSMLIKGGAQQVGLLISTVIIVPLFGGYAFQRLWLGAPRWLTRLADAFSLVLELDWLYLGIEAVLAKVRFLLNQVAMILERALCIGWVLLWILVIILLLSGG